MKSLHTQPVFSLLLFLFFFVTFPMGQLGSIPLFSGVTLYVHDIAVVFFLLFLGITYIKTKSQVVFVKTFLPLLVFIAVAILSLVVNIWQTPSVELLRGILYLLRFIAYSSIALLAMQKVYSVMWWIIGLYSTGVVLAILGIIQLVFFPGLKSLVGAGWDEHYERLFSTFFDPNFVGMFLVLAFTLGVFFLGKIEGKKFIATPSLFVLPQCVLLIAIILTYSRSAYIAGIVSIGFIIISLRLYKYVLIALIILPLLYMVIPKGSRDVNRLTREASSIARIENWGYTLVLIQERPILGHGFNLLRVRMSEDRTIDARGIISRDASGVNSSILFVFATTGLIGGILYLWWLYTQVNVFTHVKDGMFRLIGQASILSTILFSFFNHALFYPWILLWLMILLGLGIRMKKENK